MTAIVGVAFLSMLAFAAWHDLRTRRIPNRLTYPGIAGALAAAAIASPSALVLALLGLLAAGVAMLGAWAIGRGAMGLGDVKLAAFAGAVIGPASVPSFLVLSTILGGFAAVLLLLRGHDRHATFAYGPYLAVGAAAAMLLAGGPVVR